MRGRPGERGRPPFVLEGMTERDDAIRVYRFLCPECGVSDRELGHFVTFEEVHCLVCLIEEERYVRLRRWLDEEPAGGLEPPAG